MTLPHVGLLDETEVPDETAALYARARQKLGVEALPSALLRLGAFPILFRDAMLNLERVFADRPPMARRERLLIGLGVAASAGAADLAGWIDGIAGTLEVPEADRRATIEVALACSTLNAYYRAKGLLEMPGAGLDPQANLRASPLVGKQLGARTLELVCTAVSVQMNCRSCVTAHARSAMDAGAAQVDLDEAIRIQAVVVGLVPLER